MKLIIFLQFKSLMLIENEKNGALVNLEVGILMLSSQTSWRNLRGRCNPPSTGAGGAWPPKP